MLKEAIEKILDLATPFITSIQGRDYANQKLFQIAEPMAEPLEVSTLTGLVDYVRTQMEGDLTDRGHVFLHVDSYRSVHLLGLLREQDALREMFLAAALPTFDGFPFGRFMGLEEFIIQLQSKVQQDENTEKMLKLVSNIRDEKVRTSADDGMTQVVTAKVGLVTVEEARVPNPVTLRPFRTFLEINPQPASPFVFRLQSGRNDEPLAALFEADGGLWKLQAVQDIKAYLADKLDLDIIA